MIVIPFWVAVLISLGGYAATVAAEAESTTPVEMAANENRAMESDALECAQKNTAVLVDEVLVVVYHADGSEIITKSDVLRPLLGGGVATLRDKILEELMILDAKKLGISITKEDAEDFMAKLQKTRGVSRYEMHSMFQEFGYTFDEGLEALRRRQVVEQIVDFRVRSDKRMVVQKEELLAYAQEYPEYDEPVYFLAQAVVADADALSKEFSEQELASLAWEDAFSIRESELPEEKLFLKESTVGAIVAREAFDSGVELTRLVKKTPRTEIAAELRFDEISAILGQQRFALIMQEYQAKLLQDALLEFTYATDRDIVFVQK